MPSTETARHHLRQLIIEAKPGEWVTSVGALSEAADDLSTASTVGVLREAINDGWITSTRGPQGGYWRTEKPVLDRSFTEAVSDLAEQLDATLRSVRNVQSSALHATAMPTVVALESAVVEAAYGSAVRATWDAPAAGLGEWFRRDVQGTVHAGDSFGRLLVWLYANGYRRLAAIGVRSWVTNVCHLTGQDVASDRAANYSGIAQATSFPGSPINSLAAVAALDTEGGQY